jgi:enterochelin esterase-like enzyme
MSAEPRRWIRALSRAAHGVLVAATLAQAPGCNACSEWLSSFASDDGPSAALPAADAPLQAAGKAVRARSLRGAADSGADQNASRRAETVTWRYAQSEVGPMHVVISIPARQSAADRFPVLIALHGRGEAFKGPERGSRGWVDDYGLLQAMKRLERPPLRSEDLQGMYGSEQIAELNRRLARRAYEGLIVVCPYTPDILAGDRPFALADPLARFLVDELLPRVYRETPAIGTPQATGIDGVSLGGRAALLVGLLRPESFAAIGTLQPAFDTADAGELVRRAKAARARNASFALRLLTSDGDYFREPTRSISGAFKAAGIDHELVIVSGTHTYEFNRGPGAYEMLLFHDRALRASAARGDAAPRRRL